MNQRVIAILVALCVIAGGCALWHYRNVGNSTPVAKPVPTARREAADSGAQQAAASAGAGPARRAVAGKPHQIASQENLDGAEGGQAAGSPPFLQAFAVKLDDVVGVARLVSPAMPVEVLVSAHPPGGDLKQGSVTKTVLRNIQVLSAGTYLEQNPEGKSEQIEVVNLSVTPEQAVTLSQAGAQSSILLVLRNTVGTEVYELPATAMSNVIPDRQLRGAKPSNNLAKQTAAGRDGSRGSFYAVQVINGSKTGGSKISTVVFPLPEGMQ
jgi:Flp pilus assembly protein CpaB